MNFRHRLHPSRHLAVQITPMIDVVFLLIIFFMTTAQFAKLTRAELDLPREPGEQNKVPEEEGIVINITSQGNIIVSTEYVTIDRLESLVREEIKRARGRSAERAKVLIRADQNCNTRVLNQVIARLQNMGVGAARIATEIP